MLTPQLLRDTERILLLAGKKDQNMTDCDKGLLMLSVAAMRDWANGMSSYKRDVSDIQSDNPKYNTLVLQQTRELTIYLHLYRRCWMISACLSVRN